MISAEDLIKAKEMLKDRVLGDEQYKKVMGERLQKETPDILDIFPALRPRRIKRIKATR